MNSRIKEIQAILESNGVSGQKLAVMTMDIVRRERSQKYPYSVQTIANLARR